MIGPFPSLACRAETRPLLPKRTRPPPFVIPWTNGTAKPKEFSHARNDKLETAQESPGSLGGLLLRCAPHDVVSVRWNCDRLATVRCSRFQVTHSGTVLALERRGTGYAPSPFD